MESKSALAASTATPVEETPVVTGPVVLAEDVENDDPYVP
jgi:hypothetical protein